MNIDIRPAVKSDDQLIADISHQTFIETFAHLNKAEDMQIFLSQQFTKDRLKEEVGKEGFYFLLAYADGALAGYSCLRETFETAVFDNQNAIEIARFYVLENYKGQGIGKALMNSSLSLATNLNKKVVWLGVWEKNGRAINFYTRFHFQKFSEHQFALGNDLQCDWLMKKHL